MLGATGSGKSTFCNLLADSNSFKIGHGFDYCTKTFHAEQFEYNDIHYEIVDSLGLFDTS